MEHCKYVTLSNNGIYSLTDYAWDNLAECALQFTYRRVNMKVHGVFHADAFHRRNSQAYEKFPRFDSDRNISVVINAEELRQKHEEFEAQYATYRTLTKTFWQRAYEIMVVSRVLSALIDWLHSVVKVHRAVSNGYGII